MTLSTSRAERFNEACNLTDFKNDPPQTVMNELLRRGLFRLPLLGPRFQRWFEAWQLVDRLSLGDYYSPIASESTIDQNARFDIGQPISVDLNAHPLAGIDLNIDKQRNLLAAFGTDGHLSEPWVQRYDRSNGFYQQMDATVLHAMISHNRPQRIIEIGSGHSTTAILDSLSHNGLNDTTLTLIEPNPERLLENLTPADRARFRLLQRPLSVEDTDEIFELEANDILLVDSSHVYKIGSDVQLLFETVYPTLQAGVLLHIHDVFFPFDYPATWLRRGSHFNEAYVLRAFLQYNTTYEIAMWNHFVKGVDGIDMPKELQFGDDDISTSIWLRRSTTDVA